MPSGESENRENMKLWSITQRKSTRLLTEFSNPFRFLSDAEEKKRFLVKASVTDANKTSKFQCNLTKLIQVFTSAVPSLPKDYAVNELCCI